MKKTRRTIKETVSLRRNITAAGEHTAHIMRAERVFKTGCVSVKRKKSAVISESYAEKRIIFKYHPKD